MTALRIIVAGRDYEVACDDGQENHLKLIARMLDGRVRGINAAIGKSSEAQSLLLAALMLTDELQDVGRELEGLRQETQHHSQAFESGKNIELESTITSTIDTLADRIEQIAEELEALE